jgi:thiamine biosynthesis lipoprotein
MMSRCAELRRARPLLGTYVEIRAGGAMEERLRSGVASAFASIAQVQALMSFHESASDVSRMNREAFRGPVEIHEWTWRVLAAAQEFAVSSAGRFDITIAPLLSRWGYLPPRAPADETATFRDLILEPRRHVRFARALSIDLGGIAKGFAVDRAIECLQAWGAASGSVNAGGDLRVFGEKPQEISLRDPSKPGLTAGMVHLKNRAIATSGIYFSGKSLGDRFVSPLIDGRTRLPQTAPLSVAVSAMDCLTADALTKIALADRKSCVPILQAYDADAVLLENGKAPRLLTTHAP